MPRLSPWKHLTFAIITLSSSVSRSSVWIFTWHKRYEKRWGLNVWGHRGRKLNARRRSCGIPDVSVVSLAYNGEGAYSFIYTLRAYEYLGYDVAVLYTG